MAKSPDDFGKELSAMLSSGQLVPDNIVYEDIHNLRIEAVQKLNKIRPASVGQASRISGVSPSDISVLLVSFYEAKWI